MPGHVQLLLRPLLLRNAGRLLLLALLVAAGHLALLWLWDPWWPVPAPRLLRLPPPEEAAGEVTVVLAGDTAPADHANTLLYQRGFEYPFSATVDLLREADLALVNLESPLTDSLTPFPLFKYYSYRIDPRAAPALKWAGVDAVTLGNNHLLDYGEQGLRDTLEHLRAVGIQPIGAGLDAGQARRGLVLDLRGTRVGLLSYLEDSLMHSVYVRSFAWGPKPGVARLSLGALRRDLARIRGRADVVLVLPHWGRAYGGVTLWQRAFGRRMLDWGADAVIGHGPHVVQPLELYRGKPILYSLGNFAFGTPGQDWLRHGLLARLRLRGRRLRRVELIPLLVQNRIVEFKPERLHGGEAGQMLRKLAARSARRGAQIRLRGDVGVLELR